MRFPWPLYLAWKQLFPSQRKISFFSLLAVIGVALGVNVMIVVIAFMQGFQQKFRADIIDSQGHARVVPLNPNPSWPKVLDGLAERKDILGVSPYLQGQLLLQNRSYHAIPFSMGLDPEDGGQVIPLDDFLANGQLLLEGYDSQDVTPIPTMDDLEDEVVFITRQVANRLGVRPTTIIQMKDANATQQADAARGMVRVLRLDPFVPSGQWTVTFLDEESYQIAESASGFKKVGLFKEPPLDLGMGFPIFEVLPGPKAFEEGNEVRFQSFRSSILEVYSPSMIEKAKADELAPPHEVRVGGVFEVPWQGYHSEALIGTMRFMDEMRGEEGGCDGFYLKFSNRLAKNEGLLSQYCKDLENELGSAWVVVPWFVENAWFFELLKFEEYLMILIMIPIGLVAAFAIAIALMTSVMRKVREIGLLVAMGGKQTSVGAIFCLQGFIIGSLGAVFGCGLALLFIRYRDALMSLIVSNIAGESGQDDVAQFYDFYSLQVAYPWDSPESLSTFVSFAFFAMAVSTLAGLLPAWRAARMNPAEALRSE